MCHDVILELVYGVNQLCDLNPPTWTPSNECNCCILWPRLKLLWLVDGPGWPPSVLGKLEVSLGCSTKPLGLRSQQLGEGGHCATLASSSRQRPARGPPSCLKQSYLDTVPDCLCSKPKTAAEVGRGWPGTNVGPLLKYKASLVVMGPAKHPGLRDNPVSGYYWPLVRIRPPGKTWPPSVKESRVEGWRVGRQPMDSEQNCENHSKMSLSHSQYRKLEIEGNI